MTKLNPIFLLRLFQLSKGAKLANFFPFLPCCLFFGFLSAILCGCSSPSARERMEATQDLSRAHSAAYAADGFTLDFRSPPERPYRVWEFYFKHCTLVSRNPYPDRAENYCTGPY